LPENELLKDFSGYVLLPKEIDTLWLRLAGVGFVAVGLCISIALFRHSSRH
jgi:hypothetical protein